MNRGRSFFRLIEALQQPACPICALLLEDSRAYLEALFYESVLDVPTRMRLMESFGLCSWHVRQVPSLPAVCAPNVGFAIFASDLLRKLEYVGREIKAKRARSAKWLSWLKGTRRGLAAFLKKAPCPACKHLKQFERFHLNDFMEVLGDAEFFAAYKAARGICLPHFLLLDENYSCHASFAALFEAQLDKTKTLRATLEEFTRKQDFRFSDQITAEESKAWHAALETLTGAPGVFSNEMAHELWLDTRDKKTPSDRSVPLLGEEGKSEFVASLRSAKEVSLYLRKPIPESLLRSLKELGSKAPRGAVEVITEDLADAAYLRSLHEANFSLFYGLGLPQQTTILVDRKKAFQVEQNAGDAGWHLIRLKNAEDLGLTLIWHKFGNAVTLRGTVRQRDCAKALFCVASDGKREQWCRFANPATELPELGREVEIFGWEKWYTGIVEILQLSASPGRQDRSEVPLRPR